MTKRYICECEDFPCCGHDISERSTLIKKSGCYDLNGKCVNCGEYHPCRCEVEALEEYREPDTQRELEEED